MDSSRILFTQEDISRLSKHAGTISIVTIAIMSCAMLSFVAFCCYRPLQFFITCAQCMAKCCPTGNFENPPEQRQHVDPGISNPLLRTLHAMNRVSRPINPPPPPPPRLPRGHDGENLYGNLPAIPMVDLSMSSIGSAPPPYAPTTQNNWYHNLLRNKSFSFPRIFKHTPMYILSYIKYI